MKSWARSSLVMDKVIGKILEQVEDQANGTEWEPKPTAGKRNQANQTKQVVRLSDDVGTHSSSFVEPKLSVS